MKYYSILVLCMLGKDLMLTPALLKFFVESTATQEYVPVILPVDFTNGLGQLRSHGQRGLLSVGITSNPRDLSLRSKFCLPWLIKNNYLLTKEFLLDLQILGEALGGRGFLSISSEQFIKFVAPYDSLISRAFILPIQLKKTSLLLDKETQICLARQAGLPVAKSVFIAPNSCIEANQIAELSYPLFIRPKTGVKDFYNAYGTQGIKANSYEDILEFSKLSKEYGTIIQEYVEGDDDSRFFYGSLATKEGGIHGYVYKLVRAVRDHGSASLAVIVINEEVEGLAKAFLSQTAYIGPSDIAFKFDSFTDQFFFIEINCRFWKSHTLAVACGLDLPYYQYLDAIGHPELIEYLDKKKTAWWLMMADMQRGFRLIRQNRLTLFSYLKSLRVDFISAIGTWRDPWPEIYNFFTFSWWNKNGL